MFIFKRDGDVYICPPVKYYWFIRNIFLRKERDSDGPPVHRLPFF